MGSARTARRRAPRIVGAGRGEPEPARSVALLLREPHGPRLPHDRHPDLTWIAELLLDPLADLARQERRLRVAHLTGLDHDPHLTTRLDGVAALEAWEAFADGLEVRETLHVALEQLAPGAGPRAAQGVRRDDEIGDHAGGRVVLARGGDRRGREGGLALLARELGAYLRVAAALLMADALTDVMQQ